MAQMNSDPFDKPRNVILLTVDCLRWDHLSCNGYHRDTTPNLDTLAEGNLVFENAYSASSHTPEAVPAMLSGQYPDVFSDNDYQRVVPTIADLLADTTVLSGASHSNIHVSRTKGFESGFDHFFDDLYFGQNRLLALGQKFLNRIFKSRQTYYARADEINQKSLNWLDSLDTGQQFFLWNHYMDVHGPYEPLREYQKIFRNEFVDRDEAHDLFHRALDDPGSITESQHQTLIDLYDCEIRYIDDQISAFLDSIKERGLLEDSLVILTADHGDAFAEHDYYNHPRHLHEELVHVPFIVAHPSVNSERVETVISTLDIVPTILRIFNETIPNDLPGCSFQDLVSTPQDYTDRRVYLQARGEDEESHIRRFAARTTDSTAFVKWNIESDSILEKRCSDGADDLLSDLLNHCKQRSEQTKEKAVEGGENGNRYLVDDVDDRLEALGYK